MAIDYAIRGSKQFNDKEIILRQQPDERTKLLMACGHDEPKCAEERQKVKTKGVKL